jgi:serine/threonine protein kinase
MVTNDQKTVISKRPLNPPVPPLLPTKPSEVGLSLVGETLGHFQLEEFVGGGGMGAVFRAVDSTLGRTVAVKVVSNQNADEDMLRRFRNEAQSAARLDHPNIARVYYVGEEKGWSYIVFEFIEGVNIRDLVEERGPLPIDEIIRYTLQIAEALEHASERDVVHRDIKPSNILVMPDGRAKLVDMGLARLHQVDAPSQDLTETGVTLGTFDYISPEQARDPRSADVRSDLYSLGCTLYYMLTGSPPFPEGTVLQKLLSHSSDPPPDPRELRPDLDDELVNIALRLMAKLPTQRYQSPGELIDRLLILSDRLGLPHERRYAVHQSLPISSWRAFAVRHVPWIVPLLLLIGTALGLEVVLPQPISVTRDQLRPFPSKMSDERNEPNGSSVSESAVQVPPGNTNKTDAAPNSKSGILAEPVGTENSKDDTAPLEKSPEPAASSASGVPATTPATSVVTSDLPKALENRATAESNRAPDDRPTKPDSETRIEVGPVESETKSTPVETTVSASESVPSNVLIVSSDAGQSPFDKSLASLEAAFKKLPSSPQVDTIELRFRQRVEGPLTLVPRSKDGELTIRSGPDQTPLIIFRPAAGDIPDRSLFKLVGGKVNFVGVHFRVELGNQSADDWSLFHLKDAERVTFTNCSLTIRNDKGIAATFFSIDAPPASKMMMPTDMPVVSPGPTIELKSCVVRGDANVVRAVNGMPFTMNWTQGFLATSRTAVLARGIRDNNASLKIWLKFANVTGSLGAGLCLVDIDSTASTVPDLRVDTTNCVWYQLDPEVPLVEHVGIENIEYLTQNLYRYGGEQNIYPQTKILWRIQPRNGEIVNYRFRDPSPGKWYTEASVDKGVRWQRALPPEGRSTFSYSFRDFVLVPELANMAGFSESFLPEPREPDPESPPLIKPSIILPSLSTPPL